jgi:hypothetical protein
LGEIIAKPKGGRHEEGGRRELATASPELKDNKDPSSSPIEDKMRDDHLYRVLGKDTWMINIIRAIRKMPLDHLDKNSQRRVMVESQKYYWDAPYLFRLVLTVKIRQPSHEFTFGVGMTFVSYSLVLTPVV